MRRVVATAYLRSVQAWLGCMRRFAPMLYGRLFRHDDHLDLRQATLPTELPRHVQLLGRYLEHQPVGPIKECIIIGKGPSVDTLNRKLLENRLVCCVNDAYELVREHAFVFFHDTIVARHIPRIADEKKTLLVPHILSRHGTFLSTGPFLLRDIPYPPPHIVLYEKKEVYTVPFSCSYPSFLTMYPHTLYSLSGTVHAAIAFARRMGVEKIFFIGFDGTTRGGRLYGDGFPDLVPSPWHRVVYRKIRWDARVLTAALGMSAVFLDAQPGSCNGQDAPA